MRLEKIHNRPLQEDELILKKAYQNGNSFLWTEPMCYAQYENYLEEGLIVQTRNSHYYKDKTKDKRGTTIEYDIFSNTYINTHLRYGYPVLHNHEYVEIIYVAAGNCLNFFENSSLSMQEGDVCIMAPNAIHAISCTNDESCILNIWVSRKFLDKNFLNILRGGQLIASFMENILYKREVSTYILFPTGQDTWLAELARRMLTEQKEKLHAYEYSINLLASEFMLHITREYEMLAIVPDIKSSVQNDLIVAILGYLSVNYNHATLADTAHFFGYSTAYLSRTIRENTGKTYNTIISELQMEKAKTLLLAGETNLTNIAQEIGCFDSSHFTKKFKGMYGVTPKQYIQSVNK